MWSTDGEWFVLVWLVFKPVPSLHPLNIYEMILFHLCLSFFSMQFYAREASVWVYMNENGYDHGHQYVNLAQRCANPSRTLHHSEGCGLCKVHKWRPCSSQANSGPWKNPSKSGVWRVKKEPVHCSGQNAVVSCRNYRRSFKFCGARLAEERRKRSFDPCWLVALESFASMLFYSWS